MPSTIRNPRTAGLSSPTRPIISRYLLFYNLVCAVLWSRVLWATVEPYAWPQASPQEAAYKVEPWARWSQTLAIAEIIHAVIGESTN